MIAVVLVFVVTNVPAKVVQIAWSYREQTCPSIRYLVVELSIVFELLGSAINFFVYCAFLRRFRRHLSAFCPRQLRCLVPNRLLEEVEVTTAETTMIPLQQRSSCVVAANANTDIRACCRSPLVGARGGKDGGKVTTLDVHVGGTPVTLVDCS